MFYKDLIWIDFTLIAIVFVFIVSGLRRGLDKEAFSLLIWLLASCVGLNFSQKFSVFLGTAITHPVGKLALSFLTLFVLTLCLGGLISFLVSVLTKNKRITFMDRFGGIVLGSFRGIVFVTVVVILAGITPMPKESWWAQSKVIPPFQVLAIWLRDNFSLGLAKNISYR